MIRIYAKQLRLHPSRAERLLWYHLREKQIKGYKFRRQHIIDPYIVDFVCLQKRLVIELDGGQHATNTDYDVKRTHFLQSHGFKVLRF